MHGQAFCCEAGAVDGGRDFIFVVVRLDFELVHSLHKGCISGLVIGDAGEVDHGCFCSRDSDEYSLVVFGICWFDFRGLKIQQWDGRGRRRPEVEEA